MTAPSTIFVGDCREVLRTLPERSVQTVVTSPPYFGLRDYGTGEWDGGDPACDHPQSGQPHRDSHGGIGTADNSRGQQGYAAAGAKPQGQSCGKCGARRIDRQIGLEPTPSCGRQGKFKLRSDLTEDQRRYVVQRLLDAGLLDV